MKIRRIHIFLLLLAMVILLHMFKNSSSHIAMAAQGKFSVEDRLETYGEAVKKRLQPDFEKINMQYPPAKIKLLAFKKEALMEIWVSGTAMTEYKLLKTYPILALSGNLGPKLQEGDYQTPEGFYTVESLNPNSKYHLALRLNYPNATDRRNSKALGISKPGSDIMIHGKNCSIGCLAMGDLAIEEIFVLSALTGIRNISVTISPVDFRSTEMPLLKYKLPDFCKDLYPAVKKDLEQFRSKADNHKGTLSKDN